MSLAVKLSRLPGPAVELAFKRGRRVSRPEVLLIMYGGPSTRPPTADSLRAGALLRLGIVVSKKIHRDAVRRNRLRRILRESFRLQAGRAAPPAGDYVLVARDAARAFKNRQDIDAVMESLLRRL